MTEQCRQIESLLPPYVDGEASADAVAAVEAHLAACPACRQAVTVQRTVRTLLRARAASLTVEAPPGLRTRVVSDRSPEIVPPISWAWRLTAFGAAAALLLSLTIGFEFMPLRSSVLLGAQLAIDHVRCFVLEMSSTRSVDAAAAERRFAEEYGWQVSVPPSNDAAGLTFVAARRCPFWLGGHAHLLYRRGPEEVSLYVTPGASRESAQVRVFGHAERIWSVGNASFALVARGVPDQHMAPIVEYFVRATASPAQP